MRAAPPFVFSVAALAALASCGGGLPSDCPRCPTASAQAPCASASAMPVASTASAPLPGIAASSDEGMWLLNDFPFQRFQSKYGFAPSQEWLHHVQLSSVRFPGGCSGSFVSSHGLVMTNHHCVHSCVQQISTKAHDHVADGFVATAEADEVRCPAMEIDQLVGITDVTERVQGAAKGLAAQAANDAQKSVMSKIEKECATGDTVRCDVVTLYHGGRYHLYTYKRFQDVRLVLAPELAIAFFGGDPDNFNFPRYDLDTSFVRVYEGGKPAVTEQYFRWAKDGAKEEDLTFVAGHPGTTNRLLTVAELEYLRDEALPARLMRLAEARGVLTQFQGRGKEQKRISSAMLFGVENGIKALRGRYQALDRDFMASKRAEEAALRSRVDGDPQAKVNYGGAWDAIAAAQVKKRALRKPYTMIESGAGFWSQLVTYARTIVRASEELPKPNEARYREFADSKLTALRQQVLSTAPVFDDLEILTLALSLTQLREELGADDPFVKKVLGKDSPSAVAERLIRGTKLKDLQLRKSLFDGGKAAVEASTDPMIAFARLIEPDARAIRGEAENEVEAVEKRSSESIAKARFEVYGTSVYPDATFTLRLSYGQVRGWQENGKAVRPLTTLGGAFARHTGAEPFALPKSWLDARSKLNLDTPFNFCTTNDIIGGNSGSPVINKDGEIVGLIFDGNIHSLGGDYFFDERLNRAVALHSSAILEALDKVYGARRLRDELLPVPSK